MIPFKKLELVNKDQQYKQAVKHFESLSKEEQLKFLFKQPNYQFLEIDAFEDIPF